MPTKPAVNEPNIPASIQWQKTALVRTGGFSTSPPPAWAIETVQQSYDAYAASDEAPGFTSTFADETQAKAVLHQLRRAATQLGYGLSAKVDNGTLTFMAKTKKVVKPKPAA